MLKQTFQKLGCVIERFSPRTKSYFRLVCIIVFGLSIMCWLSSLIYTSNSSTYTPEQVKEPADVKIAYVPMSQAEAIIEAINDDYKFPPNLLLSMARLETNLGQSNIAQKTNNWYNIKCSGKNCGYKGYMKFSDPADGVYFVARLIKEDKRYYNWQLSGLLSDLGIIYAEDKDWAKKINQILCEYETN